MILAAGHLVTRATFLATAYLFSTPLNRLELHEFSSESQGISNFADGQNFLLAQATSADDESSYASAAPRFRSKVASLLDQDPTLAGPLIRLAFHDATTWENSQGETTGGPNGSIRYELEWSENRALSKPLALVQTLRTEDEEPVLSLADAIALSAAAAVEQAGGPKVPVRLGRPDATTADPYRLRKPLEAATERSRVTSSMPSAALDSDGLRLYFGKRLGLKEDEIVALSGVHGLGRHVSLLGMSKECLKNLTRTCLEEAPQLLPFVTSSVDRFSNGYFQYLLLWYNRQIELGDVAFIPTDVALVVDKEFRKHVKSFAKDEGRFQRSFVPAFQKLVETTATSSKRY